jgi:TolB-like protein
VTAQRVEAETGVHIWAERYGRDEEGMFVIQDEVTMAVSTAIGSAVADAEIDSAMRRPPQSLGA